MLQSQKIISCLLCIAVLLSAMVTFTCFAVDGENNEGGEVSSSVTEEISKEESSEAEESSETEESSQVEESSQEASVESSKEQQSTGNNYYYGGDVSYPPYTGSRVLKNPNIVEEESTPEEKKPVEKDINDWSIVARRWVFLPIIFTVLSLGGLIAFNLYVRKQNGKKDKSNKSRSADKNRTETKGDKEDSSSYRNFERPKH